MQPLRLFDSHLHIIDKRFPLVVNNGFVPDEFTCDDYLHCMKNYELGGGAVVSGSFQAFDQDYLVAALETLGQRFVGVTQLPENISDQELVHLDRLGVRALRFNIKRGGSERIRYLDRMARRVYETVGWHVELYVDSTALKELYHSLISLPAISIDHLGLSQKGLGTITRLAEQGIRIKASGFGRGDIETGRALRDIYSANPGALMFGTDLPSTRAARPYQDDDYTLVIEALGETAARRVFYENAVDLYRPRIATG